MDCFRWLNIIDEYMTDSLDEDERVVIEEHFSRCTRCKRIYKSMEYTISVYRDNSETSVPDEVHTRLMLFLRRTRE